MNFYKHHIGDYAAATAHLSIVEDGAYSRLIRIYYRDEGPLPVDIKAVQRLVSARSRDERDAVQTVLEEFFELREDGWHQTRCDEELERWRAQAEANRKVAEDRETRRRARIAHEAATKRGGTGNDSSNDSLPPCDNDSFPSREPSQKPLARSQKEATADTDLPCQPIDPAARAGALVGAFEGHDEPKPAPPNPAAPLAVAMNRAGFPCTSAHPDLVAYAAAGGTPQHVTDVAAHPDCVGKAARYVLRFALRELTERAAPIATGPPRNGASTSKTMQALQTLEAMKSDEYRQSRTRVDAGHDPDRAAEAVAVVARSITRG